MPTRPGARRSGRAFNTLPHEPESRPTSRPCAPSWRAPARHAGRRTQRLHRPRLRGRRRTSDSERPLTVGGAGTVPATVFEGFDYVALGHLHRPQRAGAEAVRYAGSLLTYSFDEVTQRKSVSIVEIGAPAAAWQPVRAARRPALPPVRPPSGGRGGGRSGASRRPPAHAPPVSPSKQVELRPRRRVRVIEGTLRELLDARPADEARDDYICARLTDKGALLNAMAPAPAGLSQLPASRVPRRRARRPAGPPPRRPGHTIESEHFAAFFEYVTDERLSADRSARRLDGPCRRAASNARGASLVRPARPRHAGLRPLRRPPGPRLRRARPPRLLPHPRAHRRRQDDHPRRHGLRPLRRHDSGAANDPRARQGRDMRSDHADPPLRTEVVSTSRSATSATGCGAAPGSSGPSCAAKASPPRTPTAALWDRSDAPTGQPAPKAGRWPTSRPMSRPGRADPRLSQRPVPPGGHAAPGQVPGAAAVQRQGARRHPPAPVSHRALPRAAGGPQRRGAGDRTRGRSRPRRDARGVLTVGRGRAPTKSASG